MGRAADQRRPRFGHDLLLRLHRSVSFLPELSHQPVSLRQHRDLRTDGRHDAGAAGARLSQHQLRTPTHFAAHILAATDYAAGRGLRIPLIYNTSGYETVETLRLLEGVIDIWLPDAKYADDAVARRLSGFPDYVAHNRAALREMFRQVGDVLLLDEAGMARRGMIIRHLVLPGGLAGTAEVLRWIAAELSPRVWVSLMDQYFPAYKTLDDPVLGRKITSEEYEAALAAFDAAGLEQGWLQEHEACE